MLVTHLTDVQNTEAVYSDETMTTLGSWGRLPHLMRNATAKVTVVARTGMWRVHALGADGSRRREVPSAYSGNRLSFTAAVDADPSSATWLYELVRE